MMVLSACNSNGTYKVTVVKMGKNDFFSGSQKVTVITKSGDSMECFIDESLLFNNKIPFQTKMIKSEIGRYGFIKDSSSTDTYDVTVVEDEGFDHLLGENKVIVTTKSGVSLECLVDESFMIDNSIPFQAKMKKTEEGRYGFIK